MSLIEEALKKATQRRKDEDKKVPGGGIDAEGLLETVSPSRRRWLLWLVGFLCIAFLIFAATTLLKLNRWRSSTPLAFHSEENPVTPPSGSERVSMHEERVSPSPAEKKEGETKGGVNALKEDAEEKEKAVSRPPEEKVPKKVERSEKVSLKRSVFRKKASQEEKRPDKATLNTWLKEAYLQTELGDKKRALQLYSQVLALDPHHIEALTNRGIIYEEMGDYQMAGKDLLAALTLAPADKIVLNALGVLYLEQERLEEARGYFQRANYAPAKINLALIFWQQGDFGKVKEYLTVAQRLDPQNPYVYYYWGIYYRQVRDDVHARQNFKISARLARERGVFSLLKKLEAAK
ncbi:MAG: tetratricopeptide repeat protein [Deltaproteobacteria bacterium]|nr:tetratricopeptide repeat protein [Deltaproteobacteria bacterium]